MSAPKTNKEHVSETERELKRKRIVSPDINTMPFSVTDKNTRAIFFFKLENEHLYHKKVRSLRSMYPDHVFQLSHPNVL